MESPRVDRRTLLLGSAVAAGSAVALGACGSDKSHNTAQTNEKVKLPTYLPYRGVRPDLPGNAKGLQNGFLRYPANPVKATDRKPGKGGDVSAFTILYQKLPTALGRNAFWQELNKRLGVNLKIQTVISTNYPDKLATMIAGGDLPEFFQIKGSVPQLPALLQKEFTDLSEFLSGDAVKDYPFLGNIHSESWKSVVYNGGIYGIPIPREATGLMMYYRADIFKKKGLDPKPASFAEFKQLAADLTDEKHNTWALLSPGGVVDFIREMMGMPNGWQVENGKFTNVNEMEEYKKALSDGAALVKAGYFHPDAFSDTINPKDLFGGGKCAMNWDNYSAWQNYLQVYRTGASTFDIDGIVPPNYDSGSKAVVFRGSPLFSMTAIRKSDKARVKELLGIADWLSAPFGTEEYLFRKYGVSGVDYTRKGPDPILTDRGLAETTLTLLYIADAPWPIYLPGYAESAKTYYEYSKAAIAMGVADPTLGLFSDTQARKSSELDSALGDVRNQILRGQKPVSAWDDAMQTWRSGGGDQIRKEYEQGYAHAH